VRQVEGRVCEEKKSFKYISRKFVAVQTSINVSVVVGVVDLKLDYACNHASYHQDTNGYQPSILGPVRLLHDSVEHPNPENQVGCSGDDGCDVDVLPNFDGFFV